MKFSNYFSSIQIHSINKIGDILTPGNEEFPSFSKLGCVEHVDGLLEHMPLNDRNDLKLLLTIFYFLPKPVLRILLGLFEVWYESRLPMPGVLKLIRIGLRGIIFSLYYSGHQGRRYSGKTPFEILEFQVGVYKEDLPKTKT